MVFACRDIVVVESQRVRFFGVFGLFRLFRLSGLLGLLGLLVNRVRLIVDRLAK